MAEETSNEALQELEHSIENKATNRDAKMSEDGETSAERLELMVGLLDTKFKLIEEQLEREKKLRLE